jgi:hypothetical protein
LPDVRDFSTIVVFGDLGGALDRGDAEVDFSTIIEKKEMNEKIRKRAGESEEREEKRERERER